MLITDRFERTDADTLLLRWADTGTTIADRMTDLIPDLSAAITSDGAKDDADRDRGNDWFFSEFSDKVRTHRAQFDVTTRF